MGKHGRSPSKQPSYEEKLLDPQRAVHSVRVPWSTLLYAAALVVLADGLLVAFSPAILEGWARAIEALFRFAGVEGIVAREPWTLSILASTRMPVVHLAALAPEPAQWGYIGYVTLAAWFATALLPERWTPFKYTLRFLCVVQGVALFFLWWRPASFAFGLDHFSRLQVNTAFVIMLMVGPFLGASFLLLEFSRWKKAALLAATLGYYLVAVPAHVAIGSVVVHRLSLALLPFFYLAFGPLLYSAWFVAFYSWGMSWKTSSMGMSWKARQR